MIRQPSPQTLRNLLRYDADTGLLYWLPRSEDLFTGKNPSRDCAKWNTRYAGNIAFAVAHKHGYLCGSIFKKRLLAHRVIWAMVHGEWPADQIDHINGDRADNRLKNLRSVSRSENMKNQKCPSDNRSGCPGVSWFEQTSRWLVQITSEGKTHNIGYFENLEDAIAARKAAEKRLGFHPNHGRAA